jgi:2-polyprenyl-3-methyl-5-hydroxy-6-metoxy-1,4-benzoquinol methylase
MNDDRESRLRASWTANADSWTEAVRERRIPSRQLATDDAIVAAVHALGGRRVLDVGCGEGWLARRLASEGCRVTGFDGSARLIERARELGGASFVVVSYEVFVQDPVAVGRDFDVAVANFALFSEDIGPLLSALRRVVTSDGALVIQTVHPESVARPEADAWQEETFEPLAPLEFSAMPWYFRTIASWRTALERSGWVSIETSAPTDPRTGKPASLILRARPAAGPQPAA